MQLKDEKPRKEDLIVFTADKRGEKFRARDGEILSWSYDEEKRKFAIVFKGKPNHPYSFSRERVALYHVKERYTGKQLNAVVDGKPQAFEYAQLLLPDIDSAPEILRITNENGKQRDYPKNRAVIVAKAGTSGLFRYLSAIEHEKARGGDVVESYLANRFDKLAGCTLWHTAAGPFMNPERTLPALPVTGPVIYPFGCNLSQMQAVENALSGKLSLIEGPPGTGKTQTILNIVANLIIRNKDALICSPNNAATDNVREKLERNGLGFLVARLGNTENRRQFIVSQPPYPSDLQKWRLPADELKRLAASIADAVPKLRKAFELQRQAAMDRESLSQWRLQRDYFLQRFGQVQPLSCRSNINASHLRELRDRLTELADSDHDLSFISKLVSRFAHGIGRWRDFDDNPVQLELRVSQTIFQKEIERLEASIARAEGKLAGIDADKLLDDVKRWSRMLLFAKLGERYAARAAKGTRREFKERQLGKLIVRSEYPVVTSTVNAAIGQCGAMDKPFDYVIIDESSQCTLTTGLLALASGRRGVVVGDTKQLPCVITSRDRMLAQALRDPKLDSRYRYEEESLLSCLEKCSQTAPWNTIPVQLLSEHYRCHPAIIRFCNQRFYGGELVVMRGDGGLPASQALAVIEAEGRDSVRDYNRVQAGIALDNAVKPLLEAGISRSELGVVTPYRAQADGMGKDPSFTDIDVDTVHKFQGREKDAMIFLTKVARCTSFVDDPNLVNVSVSRAKERLVLVAAPGLLEGDGNIAELARYIRYQSGKYIQADEPSMFDLLYPARGETASTGEEDTVVAEAFAAGDTLSEVIVEKRLHALLAAHGMSGRVGIVRNYPLKMFVPASTSLTPEEADFVDTRAHADFLFFRIVDKRPLAVLEVDGQQHNAPVQRHRDALKDSIMAKAALPLQRLRTNSYKPEEFLEGMVHYVGTLADNGSSSTRNTVCDGEGE